MPPDQRNRESGEASHGTTNSTLSTVTTMPPTG